MAREESIAAWEVACKVPRLKLWLVSPLSSPLSPRCLWILWIKLEVLYGASLNEEWLGASGRKRK